MIKKEDSKMNIELFDIWDIVYYVTVIICCILAIKEEWSKGGMEK